MSKLENLCGYPVNLRCHLPGEDLDVLVMMKSDDDLANVIDEYEKASLFPGKDKKIRAILSPQKSSSTSSSVSPSPVSSLSSSSLVADLSPTKCDRQKIVNRKPPVPVIRRYSPARIVQYGVIRDYSQKTLSSEFMSESEPSSPSSPGGGQSSSVSSPWGGWTRLLPDLPLIVDMAKELRSTFLNDCSTPEQESLTSQYLSFRMSGDNQTLRELRNQILARRTIRNPPPNVVPGSDNDSIASMDETGTAPFTSYRELTICRTKIALGESSSMAPSSRPEPIPDRDDVLHSWI
ncbi:uncharacterized protein LOC104898621 [Beta vulgaris subsp. vulgaris]|uniref:uncharacterized protein LOC104898621 n=1 Tax=Beta vulgaris subsp. vulgaris TaxID=3555 RepID=UPI0020367484|nr:uncharacterized protein LOC104898621 [Beta vulgaris subsp. vulgaris]